MAPAVRSARLPSGSHRAIRIFVSSTFQDMHEEREELIKQTFPKIRNLCEQRGVTWREVDLRWGITDEQRAEGKVLLFVLPKSTTVVRSFLHCSASDTVGSLTKSHPMRWSGTRGLIAITAGRYQSWKSCTAL
jgi:hypothetical protein